MHSMEEEKKLTKRGSRRRVYETIRRTINERRMRKGPLKMRRQTAAFN